MHHLDSWIKIDQLHVTHFIISLFTAQHVSNISTSIFRSLRLTVDLFRVLYCSGSMCVGVTVWFGWGGVVSLCRLKHYYQTVHHLDSWVKIDQPDVTCFIISLFTAQHVLNVSTSDFRSLRLIVDLFHVLCYEQYYIQSLHHEGKLIPEQSPGETNPLFQMTINPQPPHPTRTDQ